MYQPISINCNNSCISDNINQYLLIVITHVSVIILTNTIDHDILQLIDIS